jgi:protein disulfide-isomerase
MKKLFFVLFLAIIGSTSAIAQHANTTQLKWHTNLMEAHQLSQSTHKPIFAFFTGSDWCGWCHKLQRDVFVKPAFISWAKDKVILLELDFPRKKQLAADLVQQNNSLQQALQVQGFPTIWYFTMVQDSATKQMVINTFGSQGYPSGCEPGKEEVKFLNDANAILAKYKAK